MYMIKTVHKGFTLIELIVTTAIIIVLAAGTMAFYGFFQNEEVLAAVKTEVVQNLRYQQERAKAGVDNTPHGAYFSTSSYTLYQGQNYASRNQAADIVHTLPAGFIFSGYPEVTFSVQQGLATPAGILTITKTNANTSVTLEINSAGLIY